MTLNKAKGRMFNSVGWTWNPIAGCTHGCKYCWAKSLAERWGRSFAPQIRETYFNDKMPEDEKWIFVGSMGDIFCDGVPDEWIEKLFTFIQDYEGNNRFLLQTKNPRRLWKYLKQHNNLSGKIIAGTTIETTSHINCSRAPPTKQRALSLASISEFRHHDTFLSLEPLADFDLGLMKNWITAIQPYVIEIGLENYTHYLTPPPDQKITELLHWLEEHGHNYVLKENLERLEPSICCAELRRDTK